MSLTDTQKQTLAAALRAETDPDVVAALAIRNDNFLTQWCNTPTAFIVWRTSVTQDEIMLNGFDWVQVDNLSVGKARIWEWLFSNEARSINPSKDNVRAGISECWKGTAAMLAVQAAVLGHCKRAATWAEELFATGTGTTTTPGLLGFEGELNVSDVSSALNEF